MDEFRRPLPLRQSKEKPVLKYSSSVSGGSAAQQAYVQNPPQPPTSQYSTASQPTTAGVSGSRPPAVPLFSQSDLQMYKQQVYNNFVNNYAPVYSPSPKATGVPSTGGYGAVTSMGSPLYNAGTGGPFAHMPQLSFSNYTYLSGPGTASGQGVTTSQLLTSDVRYNDQVGVKGPSRNPYARPISAKDVEPPPSNGRVAVTPTHPLMVRNGSNVSLALKSSGSTSSLSSVGSSSVVQGSVHQTGGKIQTNAFMRPLSSPSTEHVGAGAKTPSANNNNTVSSGGPVTDLQESQTASLSHRTVVIQGPVVTINSKMTPPATTIVSSAYEIHQSNTSVPTATADPKPTPPPSALKHTVTRPPSGRKQMGIATVNPNSLGIKASGIHSAPQTRPASATNRHNKTIVRNASSGMLVSQGNNNKAANDSRTITGSSHSSLSSSKSLADSQSSGYITGTASVLSSKNGPTAPRQAFNVTTSEPQAGMITKNGNSNSTTLENKKSAVIINRFHPRDKRPSSGTQPRVGSASHVRNLNYTPSKPYSEVSTDSDTSRNSSAGSVRSAYEKMEVGPNRAVKNGEECGNNGASIDGKEKGNSSSSSNNKAGEKQKVTSSGKKTTPSGGGNTISQGKPTLRKNVSFSSPHAVEFNPEMLLDGRVKEMPVTHTMTGTIFYRKASKGEELIPRPPPKQTAASKNSPPRVLPEGAPSGEKKQEYQRAVDKGEEWTDEEEDDDEVTLTMFKTRGERIPGDGEADIDNQEEDEEDFDDAFDDEEDDDIIDNIEDDDGGESDDSDLCTRNLSASRKNSATALRLKSATKRLLGLQVSETSKPRQQNRNTPAVPGGVRTRPVTTSSTTRGRPLSGVSTISSESDIQPALMPSLFPHVPPTVNFVPEGEKVEQLPWEVRKFLRWRMSPITPNVVKNCIARSGFRATKRNHDWIGYWGKHMKAPGFKTIREYQKVNHFPGSFQIGRKDRLWRNLSKMQVHFGKKEFGFFPQTFVLPFDLKQLKRAWEDGGNKQKWIIKPPASARGIGIRVVNKWNQIPKKRAVVVQRYLARPYLINDSKFDIRLYVYVTSYDPLRIYLFDDGLARFASVKYSHSMKSINNRYMHLTNYSINKKNSEYQSNTDENVCQGHKWGLKALWGYMKQKGINVNAVWENIKDLVIKTIIVSEPYVNPLMKANVKQKSSCHELFGFDVMLDENLKPWIIEVNISPSLHSNSQLDMNIKGQMIKDLFNIAGFMIPDKNDVKEIPGSQDKYQVPSEVCVDKRLWSTQLAADERAKHAYYVQRHSDEFSQQTILETLTPDDMRILVETVDEDSRKGSFQRVFPSSNTHKYQRFFECARYYNLLVDAWVQKFNRMEARGIGILESHCGKGIHLQSPTCEAKHQWAPPNLSISRDARALSAPTSSAKAGNRVFPNLKRGPKPPSGSSQNNTPASSVRSAAPQNANTVNSNPPH